MLVVTLVFPLVLMSLLLLMERVERPLRDEATGEDVVTFLEAARPDEVEMFVSEGFAPALERYWRRRRFGVLRRRAAARSRAAYSDPATAHRAGRPRAAEPAERAQPRPRAAR